MQLIKELQRRNVFRVAIGYAVSCWLLAQAADFGLDIIGAPDWVLRTLVLLFALGFPVVVFFSWAYEVTPEGIKKESEVDRSESITHITGRKLDRAIIAVLAVALAYFIWQSRAAHDPGEASVRPAADTTSETDARPEPGEPGGAQAVHQASIAVLPFVNMSSDPEQEYFSDGLSEELLNRLARVPQLQVAARTSSFSFKGRSVEIAEVARRLNVAYVLEGSVRTAGDQVRITAQLIQAADGYHLWSEAYDRKLEDVFGLQQEIADRITAALLPRLVADGEAPATTRTASPHYTPPADAYQRYLLARDQFNQQTYTGRKNALEIMEPLVRNHPDYAEAQAFYALVVFTFSSRTEGDIPWITAEARARRALERALALDPGVAEAYLVQGRLAQRSWDIPAAMKAYEKAIEMNPSYSDAYVSLAEMAMMAGQPERAWQALERARALDPVSPFMLYTVAHIASLQGRDETAAEAMSVLAEISPESASDVQAHLYQDKGELARGVIQIEQHRARFPGSGQVDTWLAVNYAELGLLGEAARLSPRIRMILAARDGRREESLALAEELVAEYSDPHDRADVYWQVYLFLGDYDEALTVLSDLWYGYAEQTFGARMDGWDLRMLAELLVYSGRHEEAAPVIEILRKDAVYGLHPWDLERGRAQVMALDGRTDEAMRILQDLAEGKHFYTNFGLPYASYVLLKEHPDFPSLIGKFEAWQKAQRELYEELKAGESL